MGDTRTRRLDAIRSGLTFDDFLAAHRAALVVIAGGAEGTEYSIDQPKLTMGRGPGVDLAFEDTAMSREHAVVEFADGEFRIRDLGSTNGTLVNEGPIKSTSLGHGDRIRMGEHAFQFVLEELPRAPKTWIVDDA